MAANTNSEIVPIPGRCEYFMERKRRYCRTIPPCEKKFCVEHSHLLGEESDRKRVQCPLDGKHSCWEDKLKKHLEVCNSREKPLPDYHVENINSGGSHTMSVDSNCEKIPLRTTPDSQLMQLIEKVQQVFKDTVDEFQIPEEILSHIVLKDELSNPTYGTPALKHFKQQASLLGHMEKLNLLRSDLCYVEFGAGKGQLSHWIQKSLLDDTDMTFLLIDKGTCRYKMENQHKEGAKFIRLRIDIEHLAINRVPCISEPFSKNMVAISKHLCGVATDLTMRCLVNSLRDNTSDDNSDEISNSKKRKLEKSGVSGIVIALCCYHRCNWDRYVGQEFFQQHQLTAHDFTLMTSLASWATCDFKANLNKDHIKGGNEEIGTTVCKELTIEEKEQIGWRCKRLIDIGRIKYLEQNGFKCALKYYIDKSVTLENIVLLAVPINET